MKKVILAMISCVLMAGLMMGLTGCSFDINTGKNPEDVIHIDLGNIAGLDDLDLSGIDLEELSGIIEQGAQSISGSLGALAESVESIDTEELADMLNGLAQEVGEEAPQIVSGIVTDVMDQIGIDETQLEALIQNGIGASQGGSAIMIPDVAISGDMDYEEALSMLKDVLEENGMGEYYDYIVDQIQNNPEFIQGILEGAGSGGEFLEIFLNGANEEE